MFEITTTMKRNMEATQLVYCMLAYLNLDRHYK